MPQLRLIAILLSVASLGFGEKGVLNIFLSDFQNRPLGRRSGVHIGVKAPVLSGYPDDNGTLLLPIGPDINPGDTVQLVLLEPETLFMVSPWDSRAVVPKSSDYASVVLAPKGSMEALKQARVREAIAAQINSNRAPRTVADSGSAGAGGDVTGEAKATGYTPEQLREALQVWAKGVQSPRSKAIAALWAGDYNTAVRQSKVALEDRATNDKASAEQTLFEMSMFLAQALYEKGDYEQAAAAAQIAASVRPDDERALNVLGVYLAKAGKTDTALAYLRGAASLEKQLSSSSLATFNVAEELLHKGEVGAAKRLYQQVVQDQKGLHAPDKDLLARAEARVRGIDVADNGSARHAEDRQGHGWLIASATLVFLLLMMAVLAWVRKARSAKSGSDTSISDSAEWVTATHLEFGRDRPYQSYPMAARRSSVKPLLAIGIAVLVVSELFTMFKKPAAIRTSANPAATRTYTVAVQMTDPEGKPTGTVDCWSSLDGERSRQGSGWVFHFVLGPNAEAGKTEFFADDPAGGRSGRTGASLGLKQDQTVTMTLIHKRQPIFSGTVSGPTGVPVADAEVSVVGRRAAVRTNSSGIFAFPPSEATTKSVLLAVSAPGFDRTVVPRLVNQSQVEVALSSNR